MQADRGSGIRGDFHEETDPFEEIDSGNAGGMASGDRSSYGASDAEPEYHKASAEPSEE